MQWNNLVQFVFVAWVILAPLLVSMNKQLDPAHLNLLSIFDILFMLDRIFDLFVGYYNPNGL